MDKRRFFLVAVLTLPLLFTACAPYEYPAQRQPPVSGPTPPPTTPVPPQEKEPAPPAQEIKPADIPRTQAAPAVTSLIDQAWQLHRAGDYERSNAVAERAQRLASGNAEVYLVMASNYFALTELSIAKQLARQGLAASQSNWAIEQRLKGLLQRIAQAGS